MVIIIVLATRRLCYSIRQFKGRKGKGEGVMASLGAASGTVLE
jgi:hypothetical protein